MAETSEKHLYFIASALMLLLTAALYLFDADAYSLFLGKNNPVLVILALSVGGYLLLSLLRNYGFRIHQTGDNKQRLVMFAYAPVLAFCIAVVDLLVIFPVDMNILFPQSISYYPALGFVVEVIFHLAPLSIVLFSVNKVFGRLSELSIWVGVLGTSASLVSGLCRDSYLCH